MVSLDFDCVVCKWVLWVYTLKVSHMVFSMHYQPACLISSCSKCYLSVRMSVLRELWLARKFRWYFHLIPQ